jgi:serine/threonine-protein kinase
VVGTIDYLAPEQAINSRLIDVRADLYSLGCTFYAFLTGRVPFPGGNATEKLLKHRLEEPQRLEDLRPDVPAWVAAVVRKLMAKRPDDRFQSAAAVVAALELQGQRYPTERADRPARWFRGGVVVAAVLLGLVLLVVPGSKKEETPRGALAAREAGRAPTA